MIADYLYNTPPLPTDAGALVLMTQQFASRDELTSEIVGKTLAQMRALSYVIGTADISTPRFGFMAKRNLTSAYGGRTYIPNFSLATSAKFDAVRDGRARALVMVVLKDGVCNRAVSLDLAHSGVDVTATRTTFSLDDDFVSAIEGPLGVGLMLGNASKLLTNNTPTAAAALVAESPVVTMVNNVPLVSVTLAGSLVDESLVNNVPQVSVTLTSLPTQKNLTNNVPSAT